MWRVEHGDCLDVMRGMPDNSVDAVVTDPPYGLSFMGKRWDYDVPAVEVWAECLRLLKPGGHLLAFAGTRTQHRMAVRIEDAGFEIRDMIAWVYGSGFPKSHDVSKAIDKAAGAERQLMGSKLGQAGYSLAEHKGRKVYAGDWSDPAAECAITAPATPEAQQWAGWGTALKPAMEPITVARKPLVGTVAENVLAHGTGGLNIDGCRVDASDARPLIESQAEASLHAFGNGLNGSRCAGVTTQGRWPANLIHDGSEEATGLLGDAARFFYCAKASKADRDEGCEGMEEREAADYDHRPSGDFAERMNRQRPDVVRRNHHPTVKPIALMRWLCRLVTPPNGLILDPFNGSGSTGCAAVLEGFRYIGCELEAEYVEIARCRIAYWESQRAEPDLFG